MAHLRQIVVLLILTVAVFGKDHRFVEEPTSVKDDKFGGTRLSYTDKAGRVVTEHVIHVGNGDRQFIILPKQKLSDRATIYHNKKEGFTVYKDHTYGKCFLSELQPNVYYSRFVLLKYNATQDDSEENVIEMESYGQPIQNIDDVVADSTVSGLCAGLVVRTVRTADHKNRVRREISASVSCSVSVDSKGHISASASFGKGKHSSSSTSKGDGGKGGHSASFGGSVSAGKGGVSTSGSASHGEKSGHSTSGSQGSTSSGASAGSSSSKGGASSSSSSKASDSGRRGGGRRGGGRRGGGRSGGGRGGGGW